jgi:amino acid transporter
MASRLGQVIYWAASAIAVIVAALGAFFAWTGMTAANAWVVFLVIAVGVWLVGRGARYVLAGT